MYKGNMTQEPVLHHVASCCVAMSLYFYCELANRDATQDNTTQGDARIDSSSISVLLALRPTNQISGKKRVRVLKALYRVRKC